MKMFFRKLVDFIWKRTGGCAACQFQLVSQQEIEGKFHSCIRNDTRIIVKEKL